MRDVLQPTYNALINACAKCGDLDRGIMVLQKMHACNITPDAATYTALISSCGWTKQLVKALDLLHQMKSYAIRPSAATYSAIIDVCYKCGDLARAEAFTAQMQAEGNAPDANSFSQLPNFQQPDRTFPTAMRHASGNQGKSNTNSFAPVSTRPPSHSSPTNSLST